MCLQVRKISLSSFTNQNDRHHSWLFLLLIRTPSASTFQLRLFSLLQPFFSSSFCLFWIFLKGVWFLLCVWTWTQEACMRKRNLDGTWGALDQERRYLGCNFSFYIFLGASLSGLCPPSSITVHSWIMYHCLTSDLWAPNAQLWVTKLGQKHCCKPDFLKCCCFFFLWFVWFCLFLTCL